MGDQRGHATDLRNEGAAPGCRAHPNHALICSAPRWCVRDASVTDDEGRALLTAIGEAHADRAALLDDDGAHLGRHREVPTLLFDEGRDAVGEHRSAPHRVERAAEVVRHERGVYREEEEGVDGAVGGAS